MNFFEQILHDKVQLDTRRHFLKKCTSGIGGLALAGMLAGGRLGAAEGTPGGANPMLARPAHFKPKAKRVIYLHMAGSPSQLELFDHKPELAKLDGLDCPQTYLEGRRFAFIQGVPKMLGPQFPFKQVGQSGQWMTDRLPHLAGTVDDIAFLKAMHTDQFNHAPAQLLLHTGSPRLGRPSMGSWVAYGLGTDNENLPGYIVLVSGGKVPSSGKSVWGSGFLPSVYQGVQCRSNGDPILYASNPPGMTNTVRRRALDTLNRLNQKTYEEVGDPETVTRIAQYEMAFRMQMSVPEATDIGSESPRTHEMYGTEPGKTSFANNCLLARRLVERGVRFVQLYHWGWDSHGAGANEALNIGFKDRCNEVDKPIAALIRDLKQRGLFEDTLIVWGGEFGRTPMRENRGGREMQFIGRDHHTEAFTVWLAGGGVKGGISHGQTDEIGYYGVRDRTHVHDLQATILHLLGMDHERLTYQFQGRHYRLTDLHGNVINEILS